MKLEYVSFGRTGCCFIKYPTSEEADRAIGALHNQYTLPGVSFFFCSPTPEGRYLILHFSLLCQAVGPIQVRYADGERERLG